MSKQLILVAGAGIGGLTAALSLRQRGFDVTVVEQAHDLKPLGVGINLLPHAVRELGELGLADRLTSISVAPSAISYYDSHGSELFREPRGIEGGYGHPQLSVHRGRLHMMLLDAVADRLGADAVQTAARLTGFTDAADGIVGHTAAGDLRGDALVGADGINSAVRAALHPEGGPLLWSGIRMFRGAGRRQAFLDGHTMAIVKGDSGVDLVLYPIGAGLVNWVLQVPGGEPGPLTGDAGWNRAADAAEILPLVKDWRLGWLDVAELVASTDEVFEYPMVDRDPLTHWGSMSGSGRATLLGDAAHPMYPVGAILADELAHGVEDGLRRYEERRRPETADVVEANREMLRTGASRRPDQLAHVTAKYRTDTLPRNREVPPADRRRA